MRRTITILAIAALALLGLGACGSSKSSSSGGGSNASQSSGAGQASTTPSGQPAGSSDRKVRLAKTKFVLHAGLAFGAFHRYIYKPFRSGRFAGGGRVRKSVIVVKGAAAGLFAYHEVKLALTDAHSSPLLSKLVSPLTALSSGLQGIADPTVQQPNRLRSPAERSQRSAGERSDATRQPAARRIGAAPIPVVPSRPSAGRGGRGVARVRGRGLGVASGL